MVFARTYAMAVNRWADAQIDAANPRTAKRAIPGGRLSRPFVLGVAIGCAGLFWLAAAGFALFFDNAWPAVLAPVVLALVGAYSFMKRFTWLCHVFLGLALAASPLAATIAIHPPFLVRPDVYLLAGMVLCWVAGFDVIYALQDVEVDRAQGLYSMPSRLGVEPALWISRALHLIALLALGALAVLSPSLHHLFNLAVAATAALLIVEHALIIKSPQHHLNTAFFTVNGVISLLLGAAGIVDVLASN
jgi:4-hydroxybenzoate polyprenyltransferase